MDSTSNNTKVNVDIGATNSAKGIIADAMKDFSSLWEKVGLGGPAGVVAAGGIVAVGAALVGSVNQARDFQEQLTTLVTGAGESAANLNLVSSGLKDLAMTTGSSLKQLTDGMFMIESAGFHGKAGLDVLKSAAEGAKVGNADLGTVADATTTILKDFGSSGITSAEAVNTLIATVSNGKTHMEDLAGSMSKVLPTASAAKVGLNDVMGAMATMTGEGVPAANAATYLRQTILALDAPSKQAADALASVGLKSTDVANEMQKSLPDTLQMITEAVGKKFPAGSAQYVQAIKDISGGSKTMQGMLDLTGDHLKDFQANVGKVGGAAKEGGKNITGWTEVQKDFNFQLSRAKEFIQVAAVNIGTALLPALSAMMKMFFDGIQALQKFGAVLMTAMAPAIKVVQYAMDQLSAALAHHHGMVVMVENALKILAEVIGGVIIVAVVGLTLVLAGVIEALSWVINAVAAAAHAFVNYFSAMGAAAYQLYAAVAGAIGAAMNWIGSLPGRILGVVGSFSSLLYNAGRDLIQGLINGVGSMIGAAANAVKNVGSNVVNGLKGMLGIHSPSTVFAEIGMNMGQGLVQGLQGVQAKANVAVSALVTGSNLVNSNGSPSTPTNPVTNNNSVSNSNSRVNIQQLVVQAPNGATIQTILRSINQDALNTSRGLTPSQGAY